MGLEGRELPVETEDRGRDQGRARQVAGIVDEEARRKIIAAVRDQVVASDQVHGIVGVEANRVTFDRHIRVDARHRLGRAFGLGVADPGLGVGDLPLQVGERHRVVVDDADGADARRREIEHERGAEAARADDEHLGVEELLLARPAHLLQQNVAGVALKLAFVEHGVVRLSGCCLKAREEVGGEVALGEGGHDDEDALARHLLARTDLERGGDGGAG